MVINNEDIRKDIGGDYCTGCPYFGLEVYRANEVVQLGCENEELCAVLYGRALDMAREKYERMYKLP